EKLSCENKTQLEVVSPQAGTQTIDCQGSWLLFYRHWDSEWRMNRSWSAYQNGFRFEGNGSSSNSSSFWLGHELLQLLFLVRDYRLRVDYWDRSGQFRYVECNRFRISPVYQNYRLTVGNCSSAFGSDEAALIASLNGLTFSAYDWGDQRVCAASSGSA
uniref:Fibrinogen C-terminal domain-containing protein n=3 Tax=Macrostomum lignano TaxID=282301 RepID=A0A1I8G3L2_9PLAT